MKKYIVEDWYTEEPIIVFDRKEDRDDWMAEHCEWYSDGCYLEGVGKVCASCDWY